MKTWIEITYGGHDMNVLVTNRDSLGQFWDEDLLDQAEGSGYVQDEEGSGLVLCVDTPPPTPAPAPTHVVVVEWGDGTVTINGPYTDETGAHTAAHAIAQQIQVESGGADIQQYAAQTGVLLRLGDDSEDQIDVYPQRMDPPVDLQVLGENMEKRAWGTGGP